MVKSNLYSFFFGIVITLAAGFLVYKSGIVPSVEKITKIVNSPETNEQPVKSTKTTWEIPLSTKKGYPYTENGNLKIFDIQSTILKDTQTAVKWGTSESDRGTTEPVASPNLNYTAYIDKNTNDLWIMSNETFKKVKVPNSDNVTYITKWSPDGNALFFYFSPQTVSSVKEGMAPDWTVAEKFPKDPPQGYYALNIKTGEVTHLNPIENLVAVINDEEVLTRVQENKLVIFNTKDFTADYDTVKGDFGFGVGQFTFTTDGTKWAFSASDNPTTDMYIEKSDFPNKVGTILDSGGWADVQWPVISPDGTKVAYTRQEFSDELKGNIDTLWLIEDFKDKEQLGMGTPQAWVDKDNLIITVTTIENGKGVRKCALFNIPTKKTVFFTTE